MDSKIRDILNAANPEQTKTLNVDEIISSEMNNVLDYKMWLETIEMQKQFNNQVASGWMLKENEKNFDYWMAVLDETVEVLGSKHWKWWKDSNKLHEVDWDNVQVELIDIFHFVMSICIQQDSTTVLFTQLLNQEMNPPKITQDPEFFKDFWDQFLMAVQYKNLPLVAVRLVEFWYRAGGTAESLMVEYRIKNALNKIRQEFGYATGMYIKMWMDPEHPASSIEDNAAARKLIQGIVIDDSLNENIENILRNYYIKNVAI